MTKAALITLNSSDDPVANLAMTTDLIAAAAGRGATFVLTPEVTNCVSTSRARQEAVLCTQAADPTLRELREAAARHRIWLLIGSLALKTEDSDGRFANRSFLIDPAGGIVATYDKIHMFDVTVSQSETYRESAGYRPGDKAVVADGPFGRIGMTICYDLRFPYLYRDLAQAGADILTVPSAFSETTGQAHWHALLRARAIETGSYVLAPAQTGLHAEVTGGKRRTYGHSLAVSPWGEVIYDGGADVGFGIVDIDPNAAKDARNRIPSLAHDRSYERMAHE